MTSGYRTDPAAMEGLASTLRGGVTSLEELAGSAPAMPDAGPLSGDMAAVLSNFTRGAGEMVAGLFTAGDQVSAGGTDYAEAEDASRASFDGLGHE